MVSEEEYLLLYKLFMDTTRCLSKSVRTIGENTIRNKGPKRVRQAKGERQRLDLSYPTNLLETMTDVLQTNTKSMPGIYKTALQASSGSVRNSDLFRLPSELVRNILQRVHTSQIILLSRHLYTFALCTCTELKVSPSNEHMLCFLPSLTHLHSFGEVSVHRMHTLLKQLAVLPTLRRLDLNTAHAFIDELPFISPSVLQGLTCLTAIEEVDMSANSIGNLGRCGHGLMSAIGTLRNLRRLNLAQNALCAPGAAHLAEALKNLQMMERLVLDVNNIGFVGAQALAPALAGLTTLKHLSLDNNAIGPKGAAALAKTFRYLTSLRTLNLIGNDFKSDGAIALAECLGKLTQLEELRLSCNTIGAPGARALAEPLSQLLAMQRLRLDRNEFGPNGAAALIKPLASLTALCFVSLSANQIGVSGCDDLENALRPLNQLTTLNLLDNAIPKMV